VRPLSRVLRQRSPRYCYDDTDHASAEKCEDYTPVLDANLERCLALLPKARSVGSSV
jgi:hypothetical protein